MNSKSLPSSKWTSLEGWDYDGMKERLDLFLDKLDKSVVIRHAEQVMGQKLKLSEPFSAGQYWACFELVAGDGRLVIARVRLPKHPDTPNTVTKQSELYSIACEVTTMQFIKSHVPSVTIPEVYAYAGPGTDEAAKAGAVYMLIEGFYGNTLQDVEFDMTKLPIDVQEHIITQWTAAQAALATVSFPLIGSISPPPSQTGKFVVGPLSTAALEGLRDHGPFYDAATYFKLVGEARYRKACEGKEGGDFAKLATHVFLDIVHNTELFTNPTNPENPGGPGPFHLNHMDMGTQNILVDDDFNFLAIIDWEFAQTAPWQINHYQMPFPLVTSDSEIERVLGNPGDLAHGNMLRQTTAQKLYRKKFQEAEAELAQKGRRSAISIADSLDGASSRIYACLERLTGDDGHDESLAREIVRLAYQFDEEGISTYLRSMKSKIDDGRVYIV